MFHWPKGYLLISLLCWILPIAAQNPGETPEASLNLPSEKRFQFFGWADLLWHDSDHPLEKSYFNLNHAYFGVNAHIYKGWRALVEVEYTNEPDYGGKEGKQEFVLDRYYLSYTHSAALEFRLGKVNTPAGIWKPLHWLITQDTVARPIMEDNGYIPIKSHGLEVLGTRVADWGEMNYTFILAHVDEEIESTTSLDEASAAGGDLNFRMKERMTWGLTIYHYGGLEDDQVTVTGLLPYMDLKMLNDRLQLRSEALWLHRHNAESTFSWYAKVKYRFTPRHYLNLRFDEGEDERRLEGMDRNAITFTAGWWPRDQWRLKAELTRNHLETNSENYTEWSLWTGYIF